MVYRLSKAAPIARRIVGVRIMPLRTKGAMFWDLLMLKRVSKTLSCRSKLARTLDPRAFRPNKMRTFEWHGEVAEQPGNLEDPQETWTL